MVNDSPISKDRAIELAQLEFSKEPEWQQDIESAKKVSAMRFANGVLVPAHWEIVYRYKFSEAESDTSILRFDSETGRLLQF
jgi:hypothetical protein